MNVFCQKIEITFYPKNKYNSRQAFFNIKNKAYKEEILKVLVPLINDKIVYKKLTNLSAFLGKPFTLRGRVEHLTPENIDSITSSFRSLKERENESSIHNNLNKEIVDNFILDSRISRQGELYMAETELNLIINRTKIQFENIHRNYEKAEKKFWQAKKVTKLDIY